MTERGELLAKGARLAADITSAGEGLQEAFSGGDLDQAEHDFAWLFQMVIPNWKRRWEEIYDQLPEPEGGTMSSEPNTTPERKTMTIAIEYTDQAYDDEDGVLYPLLTVHKVTADGKQLKKVETGCMGRGGPVSLWSLVATPTQALLLIHEEW